MARRTSAGILLYRIGGGGAVEVLIAHMGGPFWQRRREAGAWSIPKGELDSDEDPLRAAQREFEEELGLPVPAAEFLPLGSVTQSGGKVVTAWAARGDLDPDRVVSNTFELEWPRGSGRTRTFPEVDRVAWVEAATAGDRLVGGQAAFVERLLDQLGRKATG